MSTPELSSRVLNCVARVTGEPCKFILDTRANPFQGGQRLVFALESGESQRFAVRVDRNVSEFTRSMTEEEIEMLKSMRNLQLPHLPSLVHYELEPSPPLVVTNWVDGHELTWSDATPAPHVRRHVIRTIAEVTLDLLQIQRPGLWNSANSQGMTNRP